MDDLANTWGGIEGAAGQELVVGLRDAGFVRIDAEAMQSLLGPAARWWSEFADTWADLGFDRYMTDGGRYRRRRHAVFELSGGRIDPQPHQPHFQSRDHNPLNGGIQRWFDAVLVTTANHPIFRRLLQLGDAIFTATEDRRLSPVWRVEVHQFRIETAEGWSHPTPEGYRRDGCDWVIVLLIDRTNIAEGETKIGRPDGVALGRFTLKNPGDAVLLDDRRVLHGVTPIQALSPGRPAHRDALVITFTDTSVSPPQ